MASITQAGTEKQLPLCRGLLTSGPPSQIYENNTNDNYKNLISFNALKFLCTIQPLLLPVCTHNMHIFERSESCSAKLHPKGCCLMTVWRKTINFLHNPALIRRPQEGTKSSHFITRRREHGKFGLIFVPGFYRTN